MLISCRFSIVGLHLLLLTHIAHSFVLLTANLDDVKKIARKFVSKSLAEKITDFIARATKTMSEKMKVSEEIEDHEGSSQVSAENRMYSVEKPGLDSQAADIKSKEEIVTAKVTVKIPRKTSVDKKKQEFEVTDTTRKPKKEPKPLQGRSRYIIQKENKALLTTKTVFSQISEEDDNKMLKKSTELLEDNLFTIKDGQTKPKKEKKKILGRPYKLLSGFETVENDAPKSGNPYNKGTKEDERFFNIRATDNKKVLSSPTQKAATETEHHDNDNRKQPEKPTTVFDKHVIKDNKNSAEMVPTNEPLHKTEKDEFDHYENKIIQGSGVFVAGTDGKEEKWWEKELPADNHDVSNKRKTWF